MTGSTSSMPTSGSAPSSPARSPGSCGHPRARRSRSASGSSSRAPGYPERGFLPTPGVLEEFQPPAGPFTRVDTHGRPGLRITENYDSLLSKVAVWAPDRDQAIARMERALSEFRVRGHGVHTTIGFLCEVLGHPMFRDAKHTTSLVEQMISAR